MDADFSSGVGAGEVVGKRREGLLPDAGTADRIVVENGYRRGEFVENVGVLPIGVEDHVSRTRARSNRHKRYRVRAERTREEVEVQGVHLVGAKVDAEDVTTAHVRENLMRMRSFLSSRVGPCAIADALEEAGHGPNRPIGEDPIDREVAAPVVGRVEKLSRGVNADVSGELPVRRRAVE